MTFFLAKGLCLVGYFKDGAGFNSTHYSTVLEDQACLDVESVVQSTGNVWGYTHEDYG